MIKVVFGFALAFLFVMRCFSYFNQCTRFSRLTLLRKLTANILVVGKKNSVEPWIAEGVSEYEKRLKPTMSLSTTFFKNDDDLVKHLEIKKGTGSVVLLDEKGALLSSREFATFFYETIEKGGATISLVVGGFDGLPGQLVRQNYPLISLSKMTWTHQIARLLLIEQIYRASEIRKGSGYHKG
jgi:23S rRNA (pseudouridine1915-N3)-methyltransferase